MFTLQDLIANKKIINELAKKLGFINVRVYKIDIPQEKHNLNLLVDLDTANNNANFLHTKLLEVLLEERCQCVVSVIIEPEIKPFYKATILKNNIPLTSEDTSIFNFFRESITFNRLPEMEDESDAELRKINLSNANQVIHEYDELERVKQIVLLVVAPLKDSSKDNLLRWLHDQYHSHEKTLTAGTAGSDSSQLFTPK